MVDTSMTREHPEKQFWDELSDVKAIMLGLAGADQPVQPMAPFADPENGKIWFFSKLSNTLIAECGMECTGHMCLVGKNHDYHAIARGRLRRSGDVAKVEEYWNPVVAAWYEDGKDDPDLALLELTLDEAEVWGSSGNALKFGWEIAKANILDDETPDVGARNHIVFPRAG